MLNLGIPEFWMFQCPVMIFLKVDFFFFHKLCLKPSKPKSKSITSPEAQRDLSVRTLTCSWSLRKFSFIRHLRSFE